MPGRAVLTDPTEAPLPPLGRTAAEAPLLEDLTGAHHQLVHTEAHPRLVHTGAVLLAPIGVPPPLGPTGVGVGLLQDHTDLDLQRDPIEVAPQLVPTEAGVDRPQGHQLVYTGQEVGHLEGQEVVHL